MSSASVFSSVKWDSHNPTSQSVVKGKLIVKDYFSEAGEQCKYILPLFPPPTPRLKVCYMNVEESLATERLKFCRMPQWGPVRFVPSIRDIGVQLPASARL